MAGIVPKFAVGTRKVWGPEQSDYCEATEQEIAAGHSHRSWSVINDASYRCSWLGQYDLLQDFHELLWRFATDWFFAEPSCGPTQPEDDAFLEEMYEQYDELFDDQFAELISFGFVEVKEVVIVQDFPGPGPISEDEFSELMSSC